MDETLASMADAMVFDAIILYMNGMYTHAVMARNARKGATGHV
jgi:hypothetical protein